MHASWNVMCGSYRGKCEETEIESERSFLSAAWLLVAGGSEQEIFFKPNTSPPGTRSVRMQCPSFLWLSVLFLLGEREEEQGYTGRHINGACHARWSSYAWRRMSAHKVLSSNRISVSATSSLGDIPPCEATFLENDLLLSKWSAAGPTVNPSTLSWCALGYHSMLPYSFLIFFGTYLSWSQPMFEPVHPFSAHVTCGRYKIVTSDSFISLLNHICNSFVFMEHTFFFTIVFSLTVPLRNRRNAFI